MKISIITVVRNNVTTIPEAIHNVQDQDYPFIEHLIIDGASTDGTLEAIKSCMNDKSTLISEPDNGIYDALNKGFSHSTGQIIGLLHSDDLFFDSKVLSDVANAFMDPKVNAVYGDLEYVSNKDIGRIIRRWNAGIFTRKKLSWGWMPPHPTLFFRRSIVEEYGGYNDLFKISGDYDVILRYFSRDIYVVYIPRVLVKMRVGGASNRSLRQLWIKTKEDFFALQFNKIGGVGALAWKNVSKLRQFL